MDLMYLQLLRQFELPLPGEDAHAAFSPLRGSSSQAIAKATHIRESAVAILLFSWKGRLSVLLTRRQTYEGTHSGQISFPGGKVEATDPNFEAAALRETWEEVSIVAEELKPIRKITEVYIPVSGFRIHPYVFWWNNPTEELIKNEREVSEIGFINLETLFREENIAYFDVSVPGGKLKNVAHFVQNDWKIWGATGVMLNEIREVVRL